eukprot:jgi/Mesen1/5440/ME000271S04467
MCRLPVPVVSVGNLTWGGNGKTPMVEFLAHCYLAAGITPLILTRGYGGGDEVRLLQQQLQSTPVAIGVGPDRALAAHKILMRRGVVGAGKPCSSPLPVECTPLRRAPPSDTCGPVGVAILDDGMQHLGLTRDVELVMVNAVTLWGNARVIPRGPLREPVTSLARAHIVAIHHANLVPHQRLQEVRAEVLRWCRPDALTVCTQMQPQSLRAISSAAAHSAPTSQSEAKRIGAAASAPTWGFTQGPADFVTVSSDCTQSKHLRCKSLEVVRGAVVLCVTGIGCPEAFQLTLEKG